MTLAVPFGAGDFRWRLQTGGDVRPSSTYGTAVTPAENSKGSWAELVDGALVTADAWMVEVICHTNVVSAAIRDCLVDIGIDPAAGTSYTVLIPDLLISGSPGLASTGLARFVFPLHVPAGASIAARASVNNATVGTLRVMVNLYGKPSRPELNRKGTRVEAVGVVSASSRGTAVTSGTTSEGAWTSLGTTSKDCWWWQVGFGVADGDLAANVYFADVAASGDATNMLPLIDQAIVVTTASEQVICNQPVVCVGRVPAGQTIYGRLQCSGTADTTTSLAVYGLGG